MDGTSIDKLMLEILLKENNVAKRIDIITKSIENLKKASGDIDKIADKLNNISPTSTQGGRTSKGGSKKDKNKSWIEQTYSTNKLGRSYLSQSVSVKKFNNEITKTIEKFNEQGKVVQKTTTFVDAYGNKIKKIEGKQNKNQSSSTSKSLGIFATIGKWSYLINMTRYYGRSLAHIIQLGMDYVETQNLWQVANRNNLEMAEEFVQKMNKAYGVSEATLMNYQAIFKNMLSALGDLSDEVSSGLSQQLTQMALDFSSLYNVTIPSAMQKFQAVLSGQVRPIRSVSGYDITENTIFDLYAGAGGEKTMRQLSQIEKRLLRIVAVFDQMGQTGATGDMAKTIESASNQARIMSEQFKETMTWTGQIILMWMDNAQILQKINAFLITMKEIIRAIAYDMGYSEKNFLDGLVTSAEDAGEAVDDIQGKLLSFDKFEALNSNQSNVLGIDQTVLDLLEKVNYQTEEFEMESNKIAKNWLDALHFVDENGDGIYEITKKARDFLDTIKAIGIALGAVFGLAVIKSIVNFGVSLVQWVISPIGATTLAIMAIATATYFIIKNWDSISTFFKKICDKIKGFFVSLGEAIKNVFIGIGKTIANIFAGIINAIANGFISLVNFFVEQINAMLKPIDKIAGIFGGNVKIPKWKAEVNWQPFESMVGQTFATGGFPEDGLFFANSGELVGKFSNGRTAVANNDQIVTGITQGVYSAMMAYNAQTRGQGGSGDVYLDGTKVGRVVAKGSHSEMVRVGLIKANS